MANRFDLTGRVAVVIGGTSGLGQAIAAGLAEHGARVAATGRRAERLPCDVTSRASVDGFRDAVVQEFGGVDILVCAAGYTFRKPTVNTSDAEWSALMDTD